MSGYRHVTFFGGSMEGQQRSILADVKAVELPVFLGHVFNRLEDRTELVLGAPIIYDVFPEGKDYGRAVLRL